MTKIEREAKAPTFAKAMAGKKVKEEWFFDLK